MTDPKDKPPKYEYDTSGFSSRIAEPSTWCPVGMTYDPGGGKIHVLEPEPEPFIVEVKTGQTGVETCQK